MISADQVIDQCVSTNDLARDLGERGAPHGTWISAREQTGGRGRLGRQWQSLEGNLFLSIVARIDDKSRWTWVPLAAAVGVVRVIERAYPSLACRIRIKWPNDLWLVPAGSRPGAAGAKLGGVLCEAVGTRTGAFIVIGLGLNCLRAPEGLDQRAISLSDALGADVVADSVRAAVVGGIVGATDELARAGAAGIVRDYERFAAFPQGAEIEWAAPSDASPQRGHVLGLGASGELIVTGHGGVELRLYAEDVKTRAGARDV